MKRARSNNGTHRQAGGLKKWLPLLLVVLACLVVLMVLRFMQRETSLTLQEPVYQYFTTQRQEYDAKTKVTLGKYQVRFDSDGVQTEGDPSPIYFSNRAGLILPSDMSWLDPDTGGEWRIPALSELTMDQGGIWCTVGKKEIRLTGGFLSDGKGTYLLLEQTEAEADGKRFTLSPFSFFSYSDGMVRIYEYDRENMTQLSRAESASAQSSAGWQLNFGSSIFTDKSGTQKLLAAGPSVLPDVTGKD